MSPNTVRVQKKEHIATLVLNRPEVMNALNDEMIMELAAAIDQVAADEDIKVLIIKGSGQHFSSGADMNLLDQDIPSAQWLKGMRVFGSVIRRLREIPQPVITLLRGVAAGGGANLALAADFVVAADDARFVEIFVHIGLILDGGGTYFLPRLVGLTRARELALLGNEIVGKTAAAMGLIYKSVPAEKLDAEVQALAAQLAQKPLVAMGLIKESLDGSFDKTLQQTLDWEAAHQAILFQTPQHKEMVKMFLASREQK
jgi:enoyl-CoA hydratase/carnithine racemase